MYGIGSGSTKIIACPEATANVARAQFAAGAVVYQGCKFDYADIVAYIHRDLTRQAPFYRVPADLHTYLTTDACLAPRIDASCVCTAGFIFLLNVTRWSTQVANSFFGAVRHPKTHIHTHKQIQN